MTRILAFASIIFALSPLSAFAADVSPSYYQCSAYWLARGLSGPVVSGKTAWTVDEARSNAIYACQRNGGYTNNCRIYGCLEYHQN